MRFSISPIQSQNSFDQMIHQTKLAETLGFDAVWANEHHTSKEIYPSPLMTLSVLAGKTRHIALGTDMLILPLHHPVRVAEQAAMVDIMSEGRLRLGVSAGYAKADMDVFMANLLERREIMEEGVPLIRRLWTDKDITLDNRFTHLENFTMFPKPIQKPSPPIYMGATVDAAVKRAARLGDQLLISTTQPIDDLVRMLTVYRDELRNRAIDPESKLTTINRVVMVVNNRAERDKAYHFFDDMFLKLYDRWGHSNITNLGDKSRSLEKLARDHFIIGEPSECIDLVQRYVDLGIKEIVCFMSFGNPDKELVHNSMKLLAKHIMPHFQ